MNRTILIVSLVIMVASGIMAGYLLWVPFILNKIEGFPIYSLSEEGLAVLIMAMLAFWSSGAFLVSKGY